MVESGVNVRLEWTSYCFEGMSDLIMEVLGGVPSKYEATE